jgi:hypothetical protein
MSEQAQALAILETAAHAVYYHDALAQDLECDVKKLEAIDGKSICDMFHWMYDHKELFLDEEDKAMLRVVQMGRMLVKMMGDAADEETLARQREAEEMLTEAFLHTLFHIVFDLGVAFALKNNLHTYKELAEKLEAENEASNPRE